MTRRVQVDDDPPAPLVDGQLGIDGTAVDLSTGRSGQNIDPHLAKQYGRADDAAKAKRTHCAPPGSLELPDNAWARPEPQDCGMDQLHRNWYGDPAAQLRTAYVRIAAGGQRADYSNRYKSKPGKPQWIAIGIVCPKCGAFWLRPGVDLVELIAKG